MTFSSRIFLLFLWCGAVCPNHVSSFLSLMGSPSSRITLPSHWTFGRHHHDISPARRQDLPWRSSSATTTQLPARRPSSSGGSSWLIKPFLNSPPVPSTTTKSDATSSPRAASNPSPPSSQATPPWPFKTTTGTATAEAERLIRSFVQAYNAANVTIMLAFLVDDDKEASWDDTAWGQPCRGREAIERRWRWQFEAARPQLVVDQILVQTSSREKEEIMKKNTSSPSPPLPLDQVALLFHLDQAAASTARPRRGAAWFQLTADPEKGRRIRDVFWTMESTVKGGQVSLQLLNLASNFLPKKSAGIAYSNGPKNNHGSTQNTNQATTAAATTNSKPLGKFLRTSPSRKTAQSPPERYFEAWNRRDLTAAMSVFTESVTYDDTAFPQPFQGKDPLLQHLNLCARAFPSTFTFELDQLLLPDDNNKNNNNNNNPALAVRWHVENQGQPLPFTRGLSFYQLEKSNGLLPQQQPQQRIQDGIDFVEPGPLKLGNVELLVQSLQTFLMREPVRFIPLTVWVAYMYIVFFSDGILPGANALQLEQRTWEEVRDLSLNFFLVSPLLDLPFSPMVHPMLEGVFNWLLSWAAMFAGFFSDERRDKPNIFPMVPAVLGMQLLTSAFLLPYLVLRSTERRDRVHYEELSRIAQVCESRLWGPVMAMVGTGSMVWAAVGRTAQFGGWSERWPSFVQLLSIDRVGSSFLVDLVIFGLFQGWLIDDDWKRRGRGIDDSDAQLVRIGQWVPFFGLAIYLTLRPAFPSNHEIKD